MHEKTLEGLKAWGREHKTRNIKESLSKHGFSEPSGLAVWIRKQALGEEEFKQHQAEGRKKK